VRRRPLGISIATAVNSIGSTIWNSGVEGFAFKAQQGGVKVAEVYRGTARGADQTNPSDFTSDTRMDCGSASKMVTALAVLQILAWSNLSPKSRIESWLPNYWSNGIGLDAMTFSDLLRHQTGFHEILYNLCQLKQNTGNAYNTCKICCESRQPDNSIGSSYAPAPACYDGVNYNLIRILIAKLTNATHSLESSSVTDDNTWDALSKKTYLQYLNDFILEPSGCADSDLKPDNHSAVAYLWGSKYLGADTQDRTDSAGSGGLQLSVNDILRILSAFRRKNLLLPFPDAPPAKGTWRDPQAVLAEFYGVDPTAWTFTGCGSCGDAANMGWIKNGGVPIAVSSPTISIQLTTIYQADLWLLPDDIEVAFMANSKIGSVLLVGADAKPDPLFNTNYDVNGHLAQQLGASICCPSSPTPCPWGDC
jgi:CubicO group peptidase (beta-lactamase class C family)